MCDDEREWVYVRVLQRFPGLDIYRAGQAGYDEHARTPDICDDVMTGYEASSHKLRNHVMTVG